jgi:hypothetical protein
MLYNLEHILNDIEVSINNKKPFSIARLGDGDLKLLMAAVRGKAIPWKFHQQGIPLSETTWICNLYKESCNNANYVSSFDMYFDNTMWKRPLSKGMRRKMILWKDVYKRVGIVNHNYCSPEIGFLFFLNEQRNLFSILKGKKICLITCFSNVAGKLTGLGYNICSILVPGRNEKHYSSYNKNVQIIANVTKEFDVFLVGAGSLGRGYSNYIKKNGGVAIDIGQVFDCWEGFGLPKRVKRFLIKRKNMTFDLNSNTKHFRKFF